MARKTLKITKVKAKDKVKTNGKTVKVKMVKKWSPKAPWYLTKK